MKKTIADEIQEMVNAGQAEVVASGKFETNGQPTQVRSMEGTMDPLEVGDEVTIPVDFQVISVPVGERKASCVIAEVKSTDGSERNFRFFPNSLAKNITPLDDNGKRMAKVKTTGTVAKWYQDQGTVDKAMEGLKGRTFVVTSANEYKTRNNITKEIVNSRIYEYNWKN